LHVIFGTGAIGLATFDALRHRGQTVRLVNRSGQARVPDGVEVVGGDASGPAFAIDAARGATVVYQTMNPPYAEWATQSPPCNPAFSPPPKPQAPAWPAWKTSTRTDDPTVTR
jgi:nucleoside-diphosphate-sugar epimerase